MHRSLGRRASVRRVQHERYGFEGRRAGISAAVYAGQVDREESRLIVTRFISRALLAACFAVIISAVPASAQQKADAGRRPTIFAVLNDGKTLEPIAHLEGTKPVPTVSGADEATEIAKFNAVYYPKGLSYRLIFGGNNAGTVKVEGSNPDSDCGKNLAEAAVTS